MLVYFFLAQAWGVCRISLGKEAMPVGTCTVSLREEKESLSSSKHLSLQQIKSP